MELLLKFLFQMELGILKHSFQTLYLAFFILRVFLTAFEQDASVTKELYSTLSKLLVRSEFCQQMVDLGGLEVIFKTVDVHMNQQVGLIFTITEGGITHVYRTLFFARKSLRLVIGVFISSIFALTRLNCHILDKSFPKSMFCKGTQLCLEITLLSFIYTKFLNKIFINL